MSKVRVSDQALIKFLERSGGIEIETLREQISSTLQRAVNAAAAVDADRYTITVDGLVYVVRVGSLSGPVVTTVLEDRAPGPRGHEE